MNSQVGLRLGDDTGDYKLDGSSPPRQYPTLPPPGLQGPEMPEVWNVHLWGLQGARPQMRVLYPSRGHA